MSWNRLQQRTGRKFRTNWVSSNGMWSTHLPMKDKNKQWTLGLLTLCPLWKKSPLRPQWWNRVKREDDSWQPPSTGTQIGWVLESIFIPQVTTLQNKIVLHNLSLQVETLANATQIGLNEFNAQVQATSKMASQNRLALDLLLLKEHGVCGYIGLKNDLCCIHIPNVTDDLNHQIDRIKHVAQSSRELRSNIESFWLNKILKNFGFSLTGWLAGLLQNVIVIVIIIIIICVAFSCLKQAVTQSILR